MSKPFSIQAPEEIAKEYAGNKQRIAQAAQMGIVDPTAAVLAGMFIDRMRSAQVSEGANPPTVAQQVMGGVPPSPAPPLPAGGLGATSQAAPPMTPPPMGQAMPPEEMPMGMAEGGLAGLPLPDSMFDEPNNGGFDGGYAGGGLVAFADGGEIDRERLRRALLMQESSGDYGVVNREGSGAMGGYQFMPDTARALAKRLGLEYRPDLMSGSKARSKEGIAYQEKLMDAQLEDILAFSGGDLGRAAAYHFAGPNQKGWGPKTRKYQEDIMRRYSDAKDDGAIPERDVQSTEGRRQMREDMLAFARERFGELPEGGLAELEGFYRKELDPKTQRERRKEDMWATLAQVGANMAASNSPFFLQAVGQAIAATMPGVEADQKERREAERDAQQGLREVLGLKRSEQKEVLQYAQDYELAEINAETAEVERNARLQEGREEREWRSKEAQLDRDLQRAIEKERAARTPLSDLETMVAIQQNGTPEQKAALVETLKLRQQYGTSAGVGLPAGIPGLPATAGGGQQEVVTVPWTQ